MRQSLEALASVPLGAKAAPALAYVAAAPPALKQQRLPGRAATGVRLTRQRGGPVVPQAPDRRTTREQVAVAGSAAAPSRGDETAQGRARTPRAREPGSANHSRKPRLGALLLPP